LRSSQGDRPLDRTKFPRRSRSRRGSVGYLSPTLRQSYHIPNQKRLRIVRWIGAGLIAAVTLIFGFTQAVGPPWPTVPQIRANETSTPDILPFSVRNKGVVFDMLDAQLTCNVCQASFLIEGGHRLSFAPADARSECSLGSNKTPKKTVPTNAAINYQCDSSAGMRVQNPNNNPVDVETLAYGL
jgi:hypothetical protein